MKKAKLFMMLALFVMGVSNALGATQEFKVMYMGRTVAQGAGYTADTDFTFTYSSGGGWWGAQTRTAGKIQEGYENYKFTIDGEYATNYDRYNTSIPDHITPNVLSGYKASVTISGTTVTITYAPTALKYRVIYPKEFLPTSGWTIDVSTKDGATITKEDGGDVLVLTATGDSDPVGFYGGYNSTTYNWDESDISEYISPVDIDGYSEEVRLNRFEAQLGYAGNIYIDYKTTTTPTKIEDPNGIWKYSNVFIRDSHTEILLPTTECAIELIDFTQTEVTIPVKAPDVTAIQKFGLTKEQKPDYEVTLSLCVDRWGNPHKNNNYNDTESDRSSTFYNENYTSTSSPAATYDHRNEILTKVTFAEGSVVKDIGDYAFVCCFNLTEVNDIPSTLSYLGQAAFAVCKKLVTVDFPTSCNVKTIQRFTFWVCQSIVNLYLPEGIEEIEGLSAGGAMQYMTSLTDLQLPSTLKRVGPHFLCCAQSLQTLTIPVSVEYIDGACFHGCESLQKVYILGPAAALQNADGESATFEENYTLCSDPVNNCHFYTTSANIDGYRNNPVWSKIDNKGNWSLSNKEYANWLECIPEETRVMPTKWVTAQFYRSEPKSKFGPNTKVAEMTSCDGYETKVLSDGKRYRVYHLVFTEVQGNNIPNDRPLLIKAGEETTYSFYNQADQSTPNFEQHAHTPITKEVKCEDDGAIITMKGRYLEIKLQEGEFYFKNPDENIVNGVEHPKFLRVPASSAETGYVTIDPCRCWWTIVQPDGHVETDAIAGLSKSSRVFNETTGIEKIETRFVIDAIYDLNGHKMDIKQEDLPQGLYIINGKKVAKK